MEIPVEAMGQYFSYLETQSFLSFMIAIIFLAVIIRAIFSCLLEKRKTKVYREDLTNLYVAGKIKQIAKKDQVDLEVELKEFRKFSKLMSCSYKELDNVIEDEMKEKIQKDFEEAKK